VPAGITTTDPYKGIGLDAWTLPIDAPLDDDLVAEMLLRFGIAMKEAAALVPGNASERSGPKPNGLPDCKPCLALPKDSQLKSVCTLLSMRLH
jgi:hypothetical protein